MSSIIKSSGNKSTVKVTRGIVNSLASIRRVIISPMKGTSNPSHIQIKTPKIPKGGNNG